MAKAAIIRYDQISAASRGSTFEAAMYDWDGMLRSGRNVYGNPDECIGAIRQSLANYEFDIFSATFNFGGIPHEQIKHAMRLFSKEVMPAFKHVTPTMAARS